MPKGKSNSVLFLNSTTLLDPTEKRYASPGHEKGGHRITKVKRQSKLDMKQNSTDSLCSLFDQIKNSSQVRIKEGKLRQLQKENNRTKKQMRTWLDMVNRIEKDQFILESRNCKKLKEDLGRWLNTTENVFEAYSRLQKKCALITTPIYQPQTKQASNISILQIRESLKTQKIIQNLNHRIFELEQEIQMLNRREKETLERVQEIQEMFQLLQDKRDSTCTIETIHKNEKSNHSSISPKKTSQNTDSSQGTISVSQITDKKLLQNYNRLIDQSQFYLRAYKQSIVRGEVITEQYPVDIENVLSKLYSYSWEAFEPFQ